MEENVTNINSKQKRRFQYLKGLLMRIIVVCTIFILLFFGNLFAVKILDYDTNKVVVEIQNNSFLDSIEQKIESAFSKNFN